MTVFDKQDLSRLKTRLKSIDLDLVDAVLRAKNMGLPGTAHEIECAHSRIDGILFEIGRGIEPEFAPYTDGESSRDAK